MLDTNVLLSGLLTPFGVCGDIVRTLTTDTFTLCVDARILFEYEDVLRRPRFKIDSSLIDGLMHHINRTAESHETTPLRKALPDADDHAFLEVAISAKAGCLVTGNMKHFPAHARSGMTVLTPREFLNLLERRE